MTVRIEGDSAAHEVYAESIVDVLKLRASVDVVPSGSLPTDGVLIEDQRTYDT